MRKYLGVDMKRFHSLTSKIYFDTKWNFEKVLLHSVRKLLLQTFFSHLAKTVENKLLYSKTREIERTQKVIKVIVWCGIFFRKITKQPREKVEFNLKKLQ